MDSALPWVRLELLDGEAYYLGEFIPKPRADTLFEVLRRQLSWHQPRVRICGRMVRSPRLAAWHGDPGAVYTYSGSTNEPLPWLPELRDLRDCVQRACGARFNSVLANLYRDGRDSMGWHSDAETELGSEPVIASLSVGGARRFLLRHRKRKSHPRTAVILQPGSLLLMCGSTQRYWRHRVPPTKRPVDPRINLTYRNLQIADDSRTCRTGV